VKKGLEIHHDADLPARSGLGSSSAFTVGMLNSLHALNGKIASKLDLAKQAIYVERDILKENVGSQDQVATAMGGFNKITFHNDHNFRIEPVTISRCKLNELQSNLILVFTGFSRLASEVAAEQIKNIPNKNKELSVIRQTVDHAICLLNNNSDINEFGKLLHEAWQLKRGLSHKVSNPGIDDIYKTALRNGALGGKLLGAGAGGFMLLFVPLKSQKKVRNSLKKLLEVEFAFENNGSQIVYYNP